jgi:hypothetical protein
VSAVETRLRLLGYLLRLRSNPKSWGDRHRVGGTGLAWMNDQDSAMKEEKA